MKKIILFVLIPLVFSFVSCQNSGKENRLVVFHAGSLSLPMKALADSFTVMYPKTQFRMEAAGSVDCARKITELGRSCDILSSADYQVIEKLLIPEHAYMNQPFAVNSMVIAFSTDPAAPMRSLRQLVGNTALKGCFLGVRIPMQILVATYSTVLQLAEDYAGTMAWPSGKGFY